MTEDVRLKRIETWLQIIADELYVARVDHEFEDASGTFPDAWESEGRDLVIRQIASMRNGLERLT
jgi:hypothetical protein